MSYYQQRRRNVDDRGGWLPSIFGMNPFNMMPSSMSNVFDPINQDIDRMLGRSLHWVNVPEGRRQQQQQQQTRQKNVSRQQSVPIQRQRQQQQQQMPKQRQHPMYQTQHGGYQQQQGFQQQGYQQQQQYPMKRNVKQQCKMPQKFRILIDCSSCNPRTLKTQIKTVHDQKHLIVCADEQKCRNIGDTSCTRFKRTYTLPKQCETNKMISFVTPNGQFVVEFPLEEVVSCVDIDMVPKIEKTPQEGRIVSLRVPIPASVDPAKVKLTVKGYECILRFEERFGTEDCVSRVYFYNKCRLPDGCDVNRIKCSADKHRLIITAPLRTDDKTLQPREIKIERKVRHKKLLATGGEQKQTTGQKQTTSTTQQQQQKKKGVSQSQYKSPTTTQQYETSYISSTQKQKSPLKETQKQKSPTKDIYTSSGIEKQKQKKKTSTTTGETGSDLLKSVFGTSSGQQSEREQSEKEKKEKKQGEKGKTNKSPTRDIKSEFPLLPTDVEPSSTESHQQHQQH